ncbi:putative ferric-chelate reductase 1 [Chanos chanos]|uniref:Ferric-chelate reductase 1 n=1 Tax=Chanos chanos TaxID=29144 RepID=A0A6J2V461_CHACN|nr:ferric-chelate reductase 1 [Chanos chanos]XP_030626016.1 ferric-chelate reductase 1 [Chanos chanos]
MLTKGQTLLFVLGAACAQIVTCFSNGKVSQACDDMTPDHGHSSSPEPAPYSINADKHTFNPGDQIKVTLSAPSSGSVDHFKGFLIEARNAQNLNSAAVGSFTLVNPKISQLLQCGHTKGSAVSHTSGKHKKEVQVIWTAPNEPPPSVQFLVTVVYKYKEFWVKIPGPVVTLPGVSPPPPQPTHSAKTTTPSSVLSAPFSSEGCGSTKSCLREPVGCNPQEEPQCYFLSFSTKGQTVMFELSGPADGYVSFALSQDIWMGKDDVYLCVKYKDRVDISAAYVEGRTHPALASENVLKDTAWRLADGIIQCRFSRDVRVSSQSQGRFDMDQKYYLFLAHGRAEDGTIHRHDRQPLISGIEKVITGPPEDLAGSRSPLIMKFHGAFMLIAWMTTVSTGVIIARYFKPDWPQKTLFGQKIWFQLHRTLMVVTVVLTCIGFILPFVYRGGWSKRAGSHPYLGCTVMVLAIIQPVMALFRPAPDASRRYIFNWLHFGVGSAAHLIAVVAIFLGIHQQALCLPAPWSTWIVACFVVWGVLADLALEANKRGLLSTGRFFKNFQMVSDGNDAEDGDEILFVEAENASKESSFKTIVLAVFLLGNFGFLTVLLTTISSV